MRRVFVTVLVALIAIAAPWGWPVVVVLAVSASDDFNRSDAGTLGANWTNQNTNTPDIVSNTAAGGDTVLTAAFWAVATNDFPNDHCSKIQITSGLSAGAQFVGVSVRATDGAGVADRYEFIVDSAEGRFREILNDTVVASTTFTLAIANSDTIKLCVTGSDFTLYKNDSSVNTFNDASLTTGQPGLSFFGNSSRSDNWEGSEPVVSTGVPGSMMRGLIGK
jgi:hypothetical protein